MERTDEGIRLYAERKCTLEKPQWVLMLTLAAEFLLLVVLHVLVNTLFDSVKDI